MKRMFQISRNKPSVGSDTSASSLPASGFTFVDNPQGVSAAVSELSSAIESAIDQINTATDLNPPLNKLVHGLDREGSTYDNAKASERHPSAEWKCSRAKAQLVFTAWKCAQGVCNTARDPIDTPDHTAQSDFVQIPSLGAGVNAWTSTLICPKADTSLESEYLPALVVSIQGSPSQMDHVLNPNDQPKDAKHFINPALWNGSQPLVHGGFLDTAEALCPSVSQKIQRYLETPGQAVKHVLITGHSAGGAVASLLFLHFLSNSDLGKRARFSCITFGSAPLITVPIDLSNYPQPSSTSTIAFNIINEFDLVSRADRPYMMSIVNLVRSVYGQRPIPLEEVATEHGGNDDDDAAPADSPSSKGKQPSVGDDSIAAKSRDFASFGRNTWPVPKQFYHHIGTRVVLMMRLGEDEIQLRVVEVPPSAFEKLLFSRLLVHGGASYSERIQLIHDGVFNRRKGWTGKEHQVPIVPDVLGRLY